MEVKPPRILLATDTSHYFVNDTATIVFFNGGDLEGDVRLTEVYLQDLQSNQFPLDTARFTIPPKDFTFYKFAVPEVMSGPYYLFVKGNEESFNLPIDNQLYIWINGIEADITLKTTKDIYLPADSVKPQIDFRNGNFPFDGEMELSIAPAGLYPGDTTFIAGDQYMWPISSWSTQGCTLINNQITLTGWDKLYEFSSWSITPGGKRDGEGVTSKREMVLGLLKAKRNKERGDEPIRYAAMAEHNGELYASVTTDIRRKIWGPYPNFHAYSFDLSSIASIYQFALDESYFYITDIDSGYIYKVLRSSGTVEKRWKASNPSGIGVYDNAIYVVDGLNQTIMKSSLNGDTLLVFGADSLSNPKDIAIDDSGNIFVSDFDKAKVFIFDSNGNCTGVKASGNFSQIAIDEVGYLYGADLDSMKLAKFSENGTLIEHYNGTFPDEIAVCDSFVHSANIYTTQWHDFLLGDVLKNFGRFKGYSKTKEYVWIPATYVTDFIPAQQQNSGSINWYFSFFAPEKDRQHEHWFPIDSIGFFNLEEEDTPIFKAALANPLEGTPPEVEKFDLFYVTRRYGAVVWEDSLELKYMPNDSILIEENAGIFADSGEFALWGDIVLDNGQHYPSPKMHNFYIKPSPLSLALRVDNDLYYPGEGIITTGTVVNNGDTTSSDLVFSILKRDESVFDTLISLLEPNSACTVSTILSDSGPFVLTATLFNNNLDTLKEYKAVEIEIPPLMFSTTYPCSVNHKSFEAATEIKNWWTREVDIVLKTTCDDSQYIDSFVLYPEESKELVHVFEISKNETLFVELLHPLTALKANEIRFGEKIAISMDSTITHITNPILPYRVENSGEFDCIFDLFLSIADTAGFIHDTTVFSHLLPIGDTLIGEWNPTLDYGKYSLLWAAHPESSSIILSEGVIPITITEPNLVAIDSIAVHPQCDSIGQLGF